MTVQGSDTNQVDDRVTLGIALMLGFCAVAPLLDVAAKLAAPTIPVSQITTTRFLLQGVIMLPICLWMRHPITIERSLLGLLALRGFFLILATYCFHRAVYSARYGEMAVQRTGGTAAYQRQYHRFCRCVTGDPTQF